MKINKREMKSCLSSYFHYRKWFPVVNWLPNYKLEYLQGDLVAGITVGMLLVPQSLAVAALAGVGSEYGLYSSFMGSIVNILLGTSKDSSVGPSVLVAVMVARFNHFNSPSVCSAIGFSAGLFLIILSLMSMGFLMNFVSYPVLTSFICTVAFTITSTQIPVLFGIKIQNAAEKSIYYLSYEFLSLITSINVPDFLVGVATLSIALIFGYIFKLYVIPRMHGLENVSVPMRVLWFVCVSRNSWLTVIATLLGYLLENYAPCCKLSLTGNVTGGLPKFKFPLINIQTNGSSPGLIEVFSSIYPAIYLVPLLGGIEHLSVVRQFSKSNGYESDLTQEIFNLGVANVLNSMFTGFPIGGALSRAAVNSHSNVQTPLSGLVGSVIVFLAMGFLTPVFYYVPKASLAGIIISAVFPIMDVSFIKQVYLVNKFEAIPCIFTILFGFYRMEYGMAVGVIIAAGFIMFRELRPRLHHLHEEYHVTSFRIRGGVHFPGAEFFSKRLLKFKSLHPNTNEIDIDCCGFYEIDYTVAMELKDAIMMLKTMGVTVKLVRVKENGNVSNMLRAIGLGDFICESTLGSDAYALRKIHKSIRGSPSKVVFNPTGEGGGENVGNPDTLCNLSIHIPEAREETSCDFSSSTYETCSELADSAINMKSADDIFLLEVSDESNAKRRQRSSTHLIDRSFKSI